MKKALLEVAIIVGSLWLGASLMLGEPIQSKYQPLTQVEGK